MIAGMHPAAHILIRITVVGCMIAECPATLLSGMILSVLHRVLDLRPSASSTRMVVCMRWFRLANPAVRVVYARRTRLVAAVDLLAEPRKAAGQPIEMRNFDREPGLARLDRLIDRPTAINPGNLLAQQTSAQPALGPKVLAKRLVLEIAPAIERR
jgi:hypothetical protein